MTEAQMKLSPLRKISSETTTESLLSATIARLQSPKKPPKKAPKIRKVNEYIIFYDEVLGEGQFGKVVKAQLASDLIDVQDSNTERQRVASTVDSSK